MQRILAWSRRRRRGSPTVEFILLVPFFILCLLLIWQLVILGMAVMHTQAAVRDVARVMALTDDKEKAKEQAQKSFPDMESYRIESLLIRKADGQAQVKIKTQVDLVLLQIPYRFHLMEEASAPIMKQRQEQKMKLSGGSPMLEGVP